MEPARIGADLLVERLHAHGVRTLFGMPGSHTTAIYDALARSGSIRSILVRNEQAGAFLADGFARSTGRPGVICTTAGPGATNALTGIAEAWADGVPVLLLTGQVNHDRLHLECGAYHEIDLESIVRPCVSYVRTIMNLAEIPQAVADAFRVMTQGRRRPAALILPQDLMGAVCRDTPAPVPTTPAEEIPMDEAKIAEALELLSRARRPLILAGGGAVWAGAEAAIARLAKLLECPVATSLNGKGILDERHPRALGHLRSPKGRVALPVADLVLALGCRFTEVMTGFRTLQIPGKIIQVDLEPAQIGMNYPAQVGIVGDVRAVLQRLLDELPQACASDWRDAWPGIRAARHPKPEWIIDTLRRTLPDDAIVFTDASELAYRMHMGFPAYSPRSFFYPSNFIALGWGFPAALGAAIAWPNRTVVSVSGDGGFVMTCQELATAAREQLHIIAIIHNDQTYGAIKNIQRLRYESRYRDTDLNNPDFGQLAQAFGVPARCVPDEASFEIAVAEALDRRGPSVIEIPDRWRYLRD